MDILGVSLYQPAPERIASRVCQIREMSNSTVFVCSMENQPVGLAVIVETAERRCLLHLAVRPDFQRQGIGMALVRAIQRLKPQKVLFSETDIEAVEFYCKLGFQVRSLGEKYSGIIRYSCKLNP